MTHQDFNLLFAASLFVLSLILLVTALRRHYPVRSVFVYTSIAALSAIGLLGAHGAWLVSNDQLDEIPIVLTLTSTLRGIGIVALGALVLYEKSHPKPHPRDVER